MLPPRPQNPSLYQVNTRVFLRELSTITKKKKVTLDDIPDSWLDSLKGRFDFVWLLGVWQTGEEGRKISLENPQWQQSYREQLPDFTPADVSGSPYAITSYTLHEDFGEEKALIRLRDRLHSRNLRLILDFVPNHCGPDHPWTIQHPEYFIRGSQELLERDPLNFTRVNGEIFARGRDPFFPGWADTLQFNFRHIGLRKSMQQILLQLADLCDGIRCDMAMLILPEIFQKTWGDLSLPPGMFPVDESFWTETIPLVKEHNPDFQFIAEVYWDREWDLQQEGFDWTYDKRMYDRLKEGNTSEVIGHLHADMIFQQKLVRFLENHDEDRAAAVFSREALKAAGVITWLSPGLRFFHEGQLEGRRVKISMHLGRRPHEEVDNDLKMFYERFLDFVLSRKEVREGQWQLLTPREAWEGNPTWQNFVVFLWTIKGSDTSVLAVTNYKDHQGQCYIPWDSWDRRADGQYRLEDQLNSIEYIRQGNELRQRGLYLDMSPWQTHVFIVNPLDQKQK